MKRINQKGVSAVIATVIIVAVTIAIAIAVAYWMGSLTTIFTRFEKLEVKSAYVNTADLTYSVTIAYINTGATSTSLDSIYLNGIPTDADWTGGTIDLDGDFEVGKELCETGVSKTGIVTFDKYITDPSGNQLSPGVTLTITIHTTGGKDYHTSVVLP